MIRDMDSNEYLNWLLGVRAAFFVYYAQQHDGAEPTGTQFVEFLKKVKERTKS